jgi:hypothetical protein
MKGNGLMTRSWIAVAAVALGLVVLWAGSGAPVTAEPADLTLATMPPEAVTTAYYTWYLDMLDSEVLVHPLLDDVYRSSPYLSDGLIAALDEQVAEACGCGMQFDPFLGRRELPQTVTPRVVTMTDDSAQLLVYGRFLTESDLMETDVIAAVDLVPQDGRWVLDHIDIR